MRTLKKITALVVVVAMVLSLCCINAFAEDYDGKLLLTTGDVNGANSVTVKQGGKFTMNIYVTDPSGGPLTFYDMTVGCNVLGFDETKFTAEIKSIFNEDDIEIAQNMGEDKLVLIGAKTKPKGNYTTSLLGSVEVTVASDLTPGDYTFSFQHEGATCFYKPDDAINKYNIDDLATFTVTVAETTTVTAINPVEPVAGKFGDPISILPSTVSATGTTSSGTTTVSLPVTWDASTYNNMAATQEVTGTVTAEDPISLGSGVSPTVKVTVNLSKADFASATATAEVDMIDGATEPATFETDATVTATNGLTQTVKATGTLTAAQVGKEDVYTVEADLADNDYIDVTGKKATVTVTVTDDPILAASEAGRAFHEKVEATVPALEDITGDVDVLKENVPDLKSEYNSLVRSEPALKDSKKLNADKAKLDSLTNDVLNDLGEIIEAADIASSLVEHVNSDTALAYKAWIEVAEEVLEGKEEVPGATAANKKLQDAKAAVAAARALLPTTEVTTEQEVAAVVEAVKQLKDYTSNAKYKEVAEKVKAQLADAKAADPENADLAAAETTLEGLMSIPVIVEPTIREKKDFTVLVKRDVTIESDATVEISIDGTPATPVTMSGSAKNVSISVAALDKAKGEPVEITGSYKVGEDIYTLAPVTTVVKGKSSSIATSGPGGSSGNGGNPSASASAEPTESTTPGGQTGTTSTFVDIDGVKSWAGEAIEALAAEGVINGVDATHFDPDSNVTREQFAKMIVGALGLPTGSGVTTFADVDASQWYAPYIAAAVDNGLITGYSDGWFGLGDNITREDIATILYRSLGTEPSAAATFTDMGSVADYAKQAVALLSELGVVNGYTDGTFGPKNLATRAEAAVMIYRFANLNNEPEETPAPEESAEPEASAEPDASATPDASEAPDASAEPDASETPDASATPEA